MTQDIPVAILAGGLATRLLPITNSIPKVLVPIAGRPFLFHQLQWLRSEGISNVVLCVGHLGEIIQEQAGDGREFGMHLDYSFDGPALLGTGGALKKALPRLGSIFYTLYGDSYLSINLADVAESLRRFGKIGIMSVFRNQNRWETSNVRCSGGQVSSYSKKEQTPGMEFVDYGLSLLKASALDDFANESAFDLSDVFQKLISAGQLAAYEAEHRFFEMGSQAGLLELETHLRAQQLGRAGQ